MPIFLKKILFLTNAVIGVFLAILLSASIAAAQTSDYSVSFVDATSVLGQEVRVSWVAPESRQGGSWVGLYSVGSSDQQYKTYKYLPYSGTSGELTLSVYQAGTYEVRIFNTSGYTRAAVGPTTIVVTQAAGTGGGSGTGGNPTGQYTVATDKTSYQTEENIRISFTTPSPRVADSAWVGLYSLGSSDQQYKTYKYLPYSGTSGELTLSVYQAGTYEVRIFNTSGYTRAAVSAPITVTSKTALPPTDTATSSGTYALEVSSNNISSGGSVSVSWEAPPSANLTNDWVGLYKAGALNIFYQTYRYTNGATNGSLAFTMGSPGTYEFRYFKNNGYTKVATSQKITVTDTEEDGDVLQCAVSSTALQDIVNYPERSGPVIAFGDSLTAGIGATGGQDYVSQLERKSGIGIINEGISGNTTRDALARLERDVLSENPSVVIVWLGGNDILQRYYEGVFTGAENPNLADILRLILLRITGKLPEPQGITEAETFKNITEVIERIQDNGAVVIVVGFSGGVFSSSLEGLYRQVAQTTGALYVPNALGGVIGRPSLMSDLVHPNNAGYEIVASRILPYLACVIPE